MPQYAIYAPDYTDDKALERRLAVRAAHLEAAGKPGSAIRVGGAMLAPDTALDGAGDGERRMAGSFMIIEAGSYAEARAVIEGDVYWTGNVWDKEKLVIRPYVSAKP